MYTKIQKILTKFPALKARDIAKKIDLPRDRVSAYLHNNKDKFQQDREFHWSLLSKAKSTGKSKKKIKIEFEDGWISSNVFEATLSKFSSPLETDVEFVEFILPSECKLLLDALPRFLALCNQLANISVEVTIDFSEKSDSFFYLNRIGFFDHLLSEVKILPERPKSSTAKTYKGNSENLVELRSIQPEKNNKNLINQLSDCFVNLSSKNYDAASATVFGELIGNIGEHSKTKLKGFAGLQKYGGNRPHIQTVVSDSGVGIAETLRPSLEEHHPHLFKLYKNKNLESDIKLVTEAFSKGEISRFGAGRGLGFKSSKEQALKFEANFSIRQERFSLEIFLKDGKIKEIKEKKGLSKIHGTHICFDFYVD